MADFAQRRHKKLSSKNVYEDVFGGPPKFSSRVEDYSEIFSSYSSSRTSSIPFLDLPAVDSEADSLQTSNFDYLEIFGGYDSVDYGVSYRDLLLDESRTAGDSSSSSSSSEDVWTPAETGSPSEESSENPVSLESNQAFSNIESHYGYDDGVKKFNMSYHKTNQISTEDGISGTTHIAQLNAIPAYTFVVDQNLPVQKAQSDNSQLEVANDSSLNADITDLRMDGEHYWETTPAQPATVSDQKPQKIFDGNGTYVEKPFVTVSEISLRTQPLEVPPPARPPPKFAIKHESHKFNSPGFGSSAKYARQRTASDIPPPFFDVEVDSSSSAAASAAAMKEAMEKAQATLKSAKEMMERRMDSLQRKKMGLKESSKVKERNEGGIAHDVIKVKEEETKNFDREDKQKGVGLTQIAPQLQAKPKLFNVSKESADGKNSKQCRLTQELHHVGEWKAEEQFYELVKKDTVETLLVTPEHKSERLVSRVYQNEQKEKKAERVPFVQQDKGNGKSQDAKRVVCGLEEDKSRVNMATEGGERVEHENIKADEMVCEQEEYDKRQKEAHMFKESERKQKRTCEQEQKTALEQEEQEKLKESHEKGENEKILKEAREREEAERRLKEASEKERRLKEAREREENERRLKEAREREENERRLKEALEKEENERRLKEAREREENERLQKEAREREENERLQKEAREREENERLLKEACEREENERRLKEAREREENERRLKEALEKEENERRDAKEREESERRLKEAREKEEHERRQKEAYEREDNQRRQKEAHEMRLKEVREKEENERRQKEAHEREENERRLKEALEREENIRKQKEKQEMEENERRLKEVHEREENERRLKEESEREQIETNERKLKENVEDKERRLTEVWEQQEKELAGLAVYDQQREETEEQNEPDTAPEVSHDFHVCTREDKNLKAEMVIKEVSECEELEKVVKNALVLDETKNSRATCGGYEQEGNDTTVKLDPESSTSEEQGGLKTAQNAFEPRGSMRNCKVVEVSSEQDKDERLAAAWITQCSSEHEASVYNQMASSKTNRDDNEKRFGKFENAVKEERGEQCKKEDLVGLDCVDRNKNLKASQKSGKSDWDGMKTEVELINEEEKRTKAKLSTEFNINQDKKERTLNGFVTREGSGKEGRIVKEREQEKERLRKLEEDIQREREREKDRMAVERMSREACERVFAETRERAERAAVERATAEARQRAMAEAREKLEKACAEAREKSLAEKANTEARLRAERAAVERATAEARERAEKAMAERAAMEARGRTERSVSEKYSAASRDHGLRQSTSFSSVRDAQFQGSSSFSSSQRYSNSSNHNAFGTDKNQSIEVESAQRCKARLERHQRTVERAAKALEEKNLRDYLTQREQAERNRLSETLDADVKRWSSGKEGNLRALLSTLQYILGTESGWHPIPLTDVVTAVAVKKAYRKATLCVHPDKLQQRGASIQQKYICEKVFDLLKDAWNKFNSEER